MNSSVFRAGFVCLALIALLTAAQATPVTVGVINDVGDGAYWGFDNHGYGDVIQGGPPYDVYSISSATVKVDAATDQLIVEISTDYAGHTGIENTVYGDMFLASLWTPQITGTGIYDDPHYAGDKYQAGDWQYALVIGDPTSGGTGGVGTVYGNAEVYAIDGTGTVITSYAPGYTFRNGQPVQYDPKAASAITSASMTVGLNLLTFVINDFSSLSAIGTQLALSWAMTCANDVIAGEIQSPGLSTNPVPLPAAFPLFAFAVGGLGLAGRWRRRRAASV